MCVRRGFRAGPVRRDRDGGTLGDDRGQKNEGKRRGGFPVKLDRSGRIVAGGPAKLRGHHVQDSHAVLTDHHRGEERAAIRSEGNRRARGDDSFEPNEIEAGQRRQAVKGHVRAGKLPKARETREALAEWVGDDPDVQAAFWAQVGERAEAERQRVEDHNAIVRHARGSSGFGRSMADLRSIRNADHSQLAGFDALARSISSQPFGYLLGQDGHDDTTAKLAEILERGILEPRGTDDETLWQEVFDEVFDGYDPTAEPIEDDDEEAEPFSRSASAAYRRRWCA